MQYVRKKKNKTMRNYQNQFYIIFGEKFFLSILKMIEYNAFFSFNQAQSHSITYFILIGNYYQHFRNQFERVYFKYRNQMTKKNAHCIETHVYFDGTMIKVYIIITSISDLNLS